MQGAHVVAIVGNTIASNGNAGIVNGDDSSGVVVLGRNTIVGNGAGLFNNGGALRSAGDNVVDNNVNPDSGAAPVAATIK
jgi:hypothetical protein